MKNKKIFNLLISFLVVSLLFVSFVQAETTAETADLSVDSSQTLPGDTFYFLDVFFDELKILFASSKNKPKAIVEVANERLNEKVILINKNKIKLSEKAEAERLILIWRLRNFQTNKEIAKEELEKHITVLKEVKEKVPLEAQKEITTAIIESKKVITSIERPITPTSQILPTPSKPEEWYSGDLNGDNKIDVNDVKYIIEYYRGRATPPDPVWRADVDGDCVTPTLQDVVYLSSYVNGNGLKPIKGDC